MRIRGRRDAEVARRGGRGRITEALECGVSFASGNHRGERDRLKERERERLRVKGEIGRGIGCAREKEAERVRKL